MKAQNVHNHTELPTAGNETELIDDVYVVISRQMTRKVLSYLKRGKAWSYCLFVMKNHLYIQTANLRAQPLFLITSEEIQLICKVLKLMFYNPPKICKYNWKRAIKLLQKYQAGCSSFSSANYYVYTPQRAQHGFQGRQIRLKGLNTNL